jgi:hypothetical protein
LAESKKIGLVHPLQSPGAEQIEILLDVLVANLGYSQPLNSVPKSHGRLKGSPDSGT